MEWLGLVGVVGTFAAVALYFMHQEKEKELRAARTALAMLEKDVETLVREWVKEIKWSREFMDSAKTIESECLERFMAGRAGRPEGILLYNLKDAGIEIYPEQWAQNLIPGLIQKMAPPPPQPSPSLKETLKKRRSKLR
jgi:hypothetical protein